MPSDRDLFAEEETMATMSFGDHIEELRTRLILALMGLGVGVFVAFIPGLNLGRRVMNSMQVPAQASLDQFYKEQASRRAKEAEAKGEFSSPAPFRIPAEDLAAALKSLAPELRVRPEAWKGKTIALRMAQNRASQILDIATNVEPKSALVSLAPLESFMIYFMVCIVTGLVVTSPWVFYQLWAFVAAGLYRHERHYVYRFLPFSLGLFLGGVFLCFFVVLPVTLDFLLQFNVWLGIEPTLRISDWISFATMLPLVFGVCFQTPLVMLLLERIGIFTAEDFRSKRKIAIFVMVVIAAVITPTQDPFSLMLLAGPMILLYELGIFLIGKSKRSVPAKAASA
jgi:sec-independent protein translocase protein TatC